MKILFCKIFCVLMIINNLFSQSVWEKVSTLDIDSSGLGVRSILLCDNGNYFVGTGNGVAGCIYRSIDSGLSWQLVHRTPIGEIVSIVWNKEKNYLFAACNHYYSSIIKSTDGGLTWNKSLEGEFCRSLTINAKGDLITGSNFGVWRSTNSGENWEQINDSTINKRPIVSLLTLPNGNILAGGGYDPNFPNEGGTFCSTDDGQHWHKVLEFNTIAFTRILPTIDIVAISPSAFGDKIYISEDNGETWRLRNNNYSPYGSTSVISNLLGQIFIGSFSSTILRFDNIDENYVHEDLTDTLSIPVLSLAKDISNCIYAGTYEYGLFKRSLISSAFENSKAENNVPTTCLFQNYPNPFNPSTTISFSLQKQTIVSLKIYDLLGREIEVLVQNEKSVGRHEILWVPKNLPSGIYYYKLTMSNISYLKKLAYLK